MNLIINLLILIFIQHLICFKQILNLNVGKKRTAIKDSNIPYHYDVHSAYQYLHKDPINTTLRDKRKSGAGHDFDSFQTPFDGIEDETLPIAPKNDSMKNKNINSMYCLTKLASLLRVRNHVFQWLQSQMLIKQNENDDMNFIYLSTLQFYDHLFEGHVNVLPTVTYQFIAKTKMNTRSNTTIFIKNIADYNKQQQIQHLQQEEFNKNTEEYNILIDYIIKILEPDMRYIDVNQVNCTLLFYRNQSLIFPWLTTIPPITPFTSVSTFVDYMNSESSEVSTPLTTQRVKHNAPLYKSTIEYLETYTISYVVKLKLVQNQRALYNNKNITMILLHKNLVKSRNIYTIAQDILYNFDEFIPKIRSDYHKLQLIKNAIGLLEKYILDNDLCLFKKRIPLQTINYFGWFHLNNQNNLQSSNNNTNSIISAAKDPFHNKNLLVNNHRYKTLMAFINHTTWTITFESFYFYNIYSLYQPSTLLEDFHEHKHLRTRRHIQSENYVVDNSTLNQLKPNYHVFGFNNNNYKHVLGDVDYYKHVKTHTKNVRCRRHITARNYATNNIDLKGYTRPKLIHRSTTDRILNSTILLNVRYHRVIPVNNTATVNINNGYIHRKKFATNRPTTDNIDNDNFYIQNIRYPRYIPSDNTASDSINSSVQKKSTVDNVQRKKSTTDNMKRKKFTTDNVSNIRHSRNVITDETIDNMLSDNTKHYRKDIPTYRSTIKEFLKNKLMDEDMLNHNNYKHYERYRKHVTVNQPRIKTTTPDYIILKSNKNLNYNYYNFKNHVSFHRLSKTTRKPLKMPTTDQVLPSNTMTKNVIKNQNVHKTNTTLKVTTKSPTMLKTKAKIKVTARRKGSTQIRKRRSISTTDKSTTVLKRTQQSVNGTSTNSTYKPATNKSIKDVILKRVTIKVGRRKHRRKHTGTVITPTTDPSETHKSTSNLFVTDKSTSDLFVTDKSTTSLFVTDKTSDSSLIDKSTTDPPENDKLTLHESETEQTTLSELFGDETSTKNNIKEERDNDPSQFRYREYDATDQATTEKILFNYQKKNNKYSRYPDNDKSVTKRMKTDELTSNNQSITNMISQSTKDKSLAEKLTTVEFVNIESISGKFTADKLTNQSITDKNRFIDDDKSITVELTTEKLITDEVTTDKTSSIIDNTDKLTTPIDDLLLINNNENYKNKKRIRKHLTTTEKITTHQPSTPHKIRLKVTQHDKRQTANQKLNKETLIRNLKNSAQLRSYLSNRRQQATTDKSFVLKISVKETENLSTTTSEPIEYVQSTTTDIPIMEFRDSVPLLEDKPLKLEPINFPEYVDSANENSNRYQMFDGNSTIIKDSPPFLLEFLNNNENIRLFPTLGGSRGSINVEDIRMPTTSTQRILPKVSKMRVHESLMEPKTVYDNDSIMYNYNSTEVGLVLNKFKRLLKLINKTKNKKLPKAIQSMNNKTAEQEDFVLEPFETYMTPSYQMNLTIFQNDYLFNKYKKYLHMSKASSNKNEYIASQDFME